MPGQFDIYIVEPRRVRFIGGSDVLHPELNNNSISAAPISLDVMLVLSELSTSKTLSLLTALAV
jgi:hypothetical protein